MAREGAMACKDAAAWNGLLTARLDWRFGYIKLSGEQLLTQLPVLGMFYGGETPVGSRNGHLNDAQAAVFIMVVIMLWAITHAPPHTVCTVLMDLDVEWNNMGWSITR